MDNSMSIERRAGGLGRKPRRNVRGPELSSGCIPSYLSTVVHSLGISNARQRRGVRESPTPFRHMRSVAIRLQLQFYLQVLFCLILDRQLFPQRNRNDSRCRCSRREAKLANLRGQFLRRRPKRSDAPTVTLWYSTRQKRMIVS